MWRGWFRSLRKAKALACAALLTVAIVGSAVYLWNARIRSNNSYARINMFIDRLELLDQDDLLRIPVQQKRRCRISSLEDEAMDRLAHLPVEPLKAQRRLLDLEDVIKHYSLVQDFYALHISLLLFQYLL